MNRPLGFAVGVVLAAGAARADLVAEMPPETSVFTGSTRGYYFTAPRDFRITGVQVRVASGTGHAFSNFSVLRFHNAAPPPQWSGTTNAFDTVVTHHNAPTGGFTPVSIDVLAGEVVGIYGNTMPTANAFQGTSSYANAGGGNATTVFGHTIPLYRSGMQYHMGMANPLHAMMHDVWAEGTTNTFNITRIEFCYTAIPAPGPAALALVGLAAARRRRGAAPLPLD